MECCVLQSLSGSKPHYVVPSKGGVYSQQLMFTMCFREIRFCLVHNWRAQCKLLKFSLTALLTSKSTFLTFDLLGLLKRLSPFSTEPFNWCGLLRISYTSVSYAIMGKVALSHRHCWTRLISSTYHMASVRIVVGPSVLSLLVRRWARKCNFLMRIWTLMYGSCRATIG